MKVLGAVGSDETLTLLFKFTFKALDIIHLYRTQDTDFSKAQLQFKLEKCRLYNWGVMMGLTDKSKRNLLDNWHGEAVVRDCLEQLLRLFHDAESIRGKYGCSEVTPGMALSLEKVPKSSSRIAEAFDDFKIQTPKLWKSPPAALRKSKWVVRDRKKFLLLIQEVRHLIDSLQGITNELSTAAKLEGMLTARIDKIPDVDTLCMIAAVWKESHPAVASAASTQAECLSMSSGRRRDISDWQTLVDSDVSDHYMAVSNLEDLTVTELKHSVVRMKESEIRMKEEIASLKKRNEEISESTGMLTHAMRELDGQTKLQTKLVVNVGLLALIFLPATFISTFSSARVELDSSISLMQAKERGLATCAVILALICGIWVIMRRKNRQRPSQSTEGDAGASMRAIIMMIMIFIPGTLFLTILEQDWPLLEDYPHSHIFRQTGTLSNPLFILVSASLVAVTSIIWEMLPRPDDREAAAGRRSNRPQRALSQDAPPRIILENENEVRGQKHLARDPLNWGNTWQVVLGAEGLGRLALRRRRNAL